MTAPNGPRCKLGPHGIDGVDFYHLAPRQEQGNEVTFAYPVSDDRVEEDVKTKQTIVTVRSHREPLTSLSIKTATPNFVRRAVVLVPLKHEGRDEWREVGSATISTLHFRGCEQEKLAIYFPEQRQEEYRITIENEDNPPLAITGVTAAGNQYQLKFIADGGAPYRLYYGSSTAKAPNYDAAALMAALGGRYQPQLVTLGAAVANADFHPTATGISSDNRLVLGAVIVLAVIVMAALVYGAVRRVDQLPGDQ